MTKITCPICHWTSHNLMDVLEGYCGRCHEWTSPSVDERLAAAEERIETLEAVLVHLQHHTSCTSLQFEIIEAALAEPNAANREEV